MTYFNMLYYNITTTYGQLICGHNQKSKFKIAIKTSR